jgi:hypothetical protein
MDVGIIIVHVALPSTVALCAAGGTACAACAMTVTVAIAVCVTVTLCATVADFRGEGARALLSCE